MAIIIKTPQEITQEFLDTLKALKPELNTDQTDSDWYVKGKVLGGIIAGVYADLNKVSNDAFPQSARQEAVDQHLQTWTGSGLRAASIANGTVAISGTPGTVVPVGTQFIHDPTQNVYNSDEEITLSGATGEVSVVSVVAGQDQNLLEATTLTISAPPAGLNTTATVMAPGIADGRNNETTEEGAARVLAIIRAQKRGATESDYISWVSASDSSISDVKVLRFPFGLGTVGLVITAGTTDIDTAIDNDETINFQPSVDLIAATLEYVKTLCPLTDTPFVYGPNEVEIDVEINVAFLTGDKDTVVPDTDPAITQGDLVEREIKRAIYKTPVGGTYLAIDDLSYILKSSIEEQIDMNLSASPFTEGLKYQILVDREIVGIGAGLDARVLMAEDDKAIPGTITINNV